MFWTLSVFSRRDNSTNRLAQKPLPFAALKTDETGSEHIRLLRTDQFNLDSLDQFRSLSFQQWQKLFQCFVNSEDHKKRSKACWTKKT